MKTYLSSTPFSHGRFVQIRLLKLFCKQTCVKLYWNSSSPQARWFSGNIYVQIPSCIARQFITTTDLYKSDCVALNIAQGRANRGGSNSFAQHYPSTKLTWRHSISLNILGNLNCHLLILVQSCIHSIRMKRKRSMNNVGNLLLSLYS